MPMDDLMQIVKEELESEKMRIFAKVEEEIESAKRSMHTKIKSYIKDENQTSIQTNMKLEFRNGIAQTILTGEEIKGEGGVPIEVALVDDLAGDVVDDEPEAFANVEIVLLKGKPDASDWTAEEFNANIVPQVEGKQPILAGNVALQLERGVRIVENIKIRHHASKIKPPEFMLGARVVGDCRIKEAKTEPFILKDYRIKYYKKHKNPSLSDEVSRLVYIRRGGEIDKRLHNNKIYKVEDFLIQLLINPEGLKSIVKSPSKMWEAIVNNARACQSGKRVYFYMDLERKAGVVFNILGDMLGLCSGSCYSQTSTLSETLKADAEKLLECAYRKWEEVKAFDEQNSLQQHLAGLSTNIDPSDCGEASEMVGESSSRRSYPLFHCAASTMNLFGETDFGSFTTFSDDVIDVMHDAAMKYNHAWPLSPILDEGLMIKSNGADKEESAAAADDDDDEPQIVSKTNPPKGWRKLFCVSKWFSVRRRVSLDVSSPIRKKQKID